MEERLTMNIEKKVIILEPLLEERAGDLNAYQCGELAAVYERWARQLRVKQAMLMKYQRPFLHWGLKQLQASLLRLN